MATVYQRIVHLGVTPDAETKIKIGKEVAEEYFKIPEKNRMYLFRVESVEPEGTFSVWSYPNRFVSVIDAIIKKYSRPRRPRRKFEQIKRR